MKNFIIKFKNWFIGLFIGGVVLAAGTVFVETPPFGAGLTPIQQEIIDKPYLKLKATPNKILFNQQITIPEQIVSISSSTKETIIIPAKTFIKYDYISNVEILQAEEIINGKTIKEDLSKRTESSQHFEIEKTATSTKYQGKFFTGQPFYKDAGKWFQVETATTTLEAWNEQNKLTVFENIKSFIKKFAGLPLAVMGTTDTFRPAAGSNAPFDGRLLRDGDNVTWATIRDNTVANYVGDSDTTLSIQILTSTTQDQWARMYRILFGFPTSSIDDAATISSATFSVRGDGKNDLFTEKQSAVVDRRIPASNSTATDTDYNRTGWDGVRQAADITFADYSTTGFNTFTLNATGLSNINKTGYTWFGLRISADFDNAQPTWVSDTDANASFRTADYAGTDSDPYLSVTYTIIFIPQPSIY